MFLQIRFGTMLQTSVGFVLHDPGMMTHTLSFPAPSQWYPQSFLYSVLHSVSVKDSETAPFSCPLQILL